MSFWSVCVFVAYVNCDQRSRAGWFVAIDGGDVPSPSLLGPA